MPRLLPHHSAVWLVVYVLRASHHSVTTPRRRQGRDSDRSAQTAAALRGAPVALEVDGVDETRQVGWSVVVRGRAEEVTDEDQVAELRQTPLLAWHPGPVPRYVRINASQVIGRRIKIADIPPDWWG